MKLPHLQRYLSHITFFVLLFTGLIWLFFEFFVDYSSSLHFLRIWSLRLHGAASYGFLIVFGMIISTHISFNWRVKKNRRISGIILVTFFVILILTGYGLYYSGNEQFRNFISYLHWICGSICSTFFIWHFGIIKK